jgi:hypothetical protein
MSAQAAQDPQRETPPPSVGALLAAGVAARTLSTPPDEAREPAAAGAPNKAGTPPRR